MDGVNLMPYLTGMNNVPPHQTFFWRIGTRYAVRRGNWKLLRTSDDQIQLFDLSTDVGESNDLSEQRPDVVKELVEALDIWEKDLVPPRWVRARRQKKRLREQRSSRKE